MSRTSAPSKSFRQSSQHKIGGLPPIELLTHRLGIPNTSEDQPPNANNLGKASGAQMGAQENCAPADNSDFQLVDVRTLAKILNVAVGTVYYWSSRGEIPIAIKTGRVLRFNPDEVLQHFSAQVRESTRTCTVFPLLLSRRSSSLKTQNASRASNRKEKK
jgi:excisionase family DNA binding protein